MRQENALASATTTTTTTTISTISTTTAAREEDTPLDHDTQTSQTPSRRVTRLTKRKANSQLNSESTPTTSSNNATKMDLEDPQTTNVPSDTIINESDNEQENTDRNSGTYLLRHKRQSIVPQKRFETLMGSM